MTDLLFEIGSEELPSGSVQPLAEALATNITQEFSKANLSYGEVRCFATPRRLAVIMHDVQTVQANQHVVRRGPAVTAAHNAAGEPMPALIGFAKSCGVSIDNLVTMKNDKGEWWIYESNQVGSHVRDLLPGIVTRAVEQLPIAKPMRWGNGETLFARPVHWCVLLLDDELINANILGVTTSRSTYGHRFHAPQAFELRHPDNYEKVLQDAYVIADFSKRRQIIEAQIKSCADEKRAIAVMPAHLLNEVTSIVEWPQTLVAAFDEAFLDVPAEALIAAMQVHQKSFALQDHEGALLPYFITVANIKSRDSDAVIRGNEKVMHARLSDASFFYHQDKKRSLEHYCEATHQVVFQEKLGSLADKSERIAALMDAFINPLKLNPSDAGRASQLCKCDLLTGMVGEFPELQGLMGYYYALNDGESKDVAQALNEQYQPRFAGDTLPLSPLGTALSLTDRLDTLVGIFAIGQKPSGVKDPFKLRRHALAVVRMLVHVPAGLNLSMLLHKARHVYGERISMSDDVLLELQQFILERAFSFYQGQGIHQDVVHAVRARQEDNLSDMDKRIQSLQAFLKQPESKALAAACKRVNNLLSNASLKDDAYAIDASLFIEPAETLLHQTMVDLEQVMAPLYLSGDYMRILDHLANLRQPVDAFFEHVMVMVDDQALLRNRLSLLSNLKGLLQGVADISRLSV